MPDLPYLRQLLNVIHHIPKANDIYRGTAAPAPLVWDQGSYRYPIDPHGKPADHWEPGCGTACCVAGFAAVFDPSVTWSTEPPSYNEVIDKETGANLGHIEDWALVRLDLEKYAAADLDVFDGSNTLDMLEDMYAELCHDNNVTPEPPGPPTILDTVTG